MEREPIRVYSKENCMMCTATERKLGKMGIKYEVIMLENEPEKREEFMEQGYLQAPIVVTENDTWSGFNPDKLKELGEQ